MTKPTGKQKFLRYIKSASGYWKGRSGWKAWGLVILLVVLILAQLAVQYLINVWNRDFFNALDKRNVSQLFAQAQKFVPLAISSIVIAIVNVWAKMTMQRGWRAWLSKLLIRYWIDNNHYRQIRVSESALSNAEYRIAEDARVSTDVPIDLVLGLLTSVLTAFTFIGVLLEVGKTLEINLAGTSLAIPGYLVVSAVAYSLLLTVSMMLVGRNLTKVVESKNHAEAEFRAAASKLREHGQDKTHMVKEALEARAVESTFDLVILWWKNLCWHLMRTTFVAQANGLIAPIIGLLLCTPKYLQGGMSLGQVVQASAAFVIVQGSLNWLMDNYPRIADWVSSANRVGLLLRAIDEVAQKNSHP